MPQGQAAQIHGNKLLLWRLENGLTLRDLAEKCGDAGEPVCFSTLNRIERGLTTYPRPRLIRALANVLGVNVRDLVELGVAA